MMMTWIARQHVSRVLLLAAAWPLLLAIVVLINLASVLFGGGLPVAFSVSVANWPLFLLFVAGPPLAIVVLWWYARRIRTPAT